MISDMDRRNADAVATSFGHFAVAIVGLSKPRGDLWNWIMRSHVSDLSYEQCLRR